MNIDIISRLQNLPVGKFHYKLLVLVGLGWLFDAMDTGLVSFVLATLGKEWGLTPKELGWVVSTGFIGMAIGAVFGGKAADKIGRKTVLAATLVIYCTATGLCAFAPNLEWLLLFRFLVGIGLGAQLPVAVTLVSEYVPAEVRGRFIVLLESFWGLGWLAAALISYFFIPRYGWHSAFLIGAIPVFYAWVIWKYVPESVPYLINKGRAKEAHAIICRLEAEAGLPIASEAVVAETVARKPVQFGQLWQHPFAKRTLMLWLVWFGIVFSYYGIFTWLPKLLVEQGYTVVKTFEYVLVMILAQLPGYFAAAFLVEKIGRKATLAGFLAACAVCAYFFGQGGSIAAVVFWGCMMSFFNLGAWGVLYTYTPELYPVHFRAFGAGWAGAVGRIGGILAPMVVASMIGLPNGFSKIFIMFTAVMLLVAAVIMVLGEETKGRKLEDISA